MEEFNLIATMAAGLEACVKRELVELGFGDARVSSPGRIWFRAGLDGLARANLWLRTADRVLLVMGQFEARDFGELFDQTNALPWDRWIPAAGRFPVSGRSYKSQLTSVPACQKIVKKAIVEKLLSAHGVAELPETGATFAIEIALRDDTATVTLDTTGPGLNKRGYRAAAGPAPLKETLAAAMIQLSFWKPERQLIDPFCGGGTIPIEAAMIGRNIAPGLKRKFVAETWPEIPAEIWETERANARDSVRPALPLRIIGTDIEPKAISLSSYHAELAGVAGDIHFQQGAFEQLASAREYGCVICNPPYGRRFEDTPDVTAIYESMPDVFRTLKTWSFYVLTSQDLERFLGQRADRRRKLYNGQIECVYYQFYGPRPPKGFGKESPQPQAAPATDQPPAAQESAEPAGEQVESAFGGLKQNSAHQAEIFANRLQKKARHMRRWPKRGITCYRVYNRDIPEVPVTVDLYEGRAHIAEFDRPHDRTPAEHADWLDMLVRVAGEVLGIAADDIYLKRRQRQRGAEQYNRVSRSRKVYTVGEGGLKFEVNLSDYLDTGLFLDHRLTREMVRQESAGKRMLNLFAYTGSFSVYAAAGGAKSTTTLDLSNTYLDWANRNMHANGFDGPQHRYICSDAMEFLRSQPLGGKFDLAVIDPPTFSNSKQIQDVFDVQRHYCELLTVAARLMPSGGVIYFSTNFRRFKLDQAELPSLDIEDITSSTVPEDFSNKRTHKCWRMVVR